MLHASSEALSEADCGVERTEKASFFSKPTFAVYSTSTSRVSSAQNHFQAIETPYKFIFWYKQLDFEYQLGSLSG